METNNKSIIGIELRSCSHFFTIWTTKAEDHMDDIANELSTVNVGHHALDTDGLLMY